MNAKVHQMLNRQITEEFYSAYLYLDFANHFECAGLDGFANWYKIQAREESDHAMLIYQYLQNENQAVTLEAINEPKIKPDGHLDVLIAGLEHERLVTSLINAIHFAASDARELRTMKFLDWFVEEQAEEEKSAGDLIVKMELFGSDPKGLYTLDKELSLRVYSPPSLVLS